MRLIDADKLMESLNPKESVWVGLVLSELIYNAPTVEAIPIEFIKKYYEDITMPHTDTRIQFEEMIRKWEKENETD